LIFPKV